MSEESGGNNTIKALAAILVILIACGWTFSRVRSAQIGAKANNGVQEEESRLTPADMKQVNHEAAVAAGLSPDQQQKVEAISSQMAALWADGGGPGSWDTMTTEARQQRMDKMQDLRKQMEEAMSPEQQKDYQQAAGNKMRAAAQQRQARLKAALSDDGFKQYQEKRRQRFGGGGGRGGPGGGGGGRGGGGGGNTGGAPTPPSTTPRSIIL